MGDSSSDHLCSRFVEEFGEEIEKACHIDLPEVVETSCGFSGDDYYVRMFYSIKDRSDVIHCLAADNIFFSPGNDDRDTIAQDLAEVLFPGHGEEHYAEILERLERIYE